MKEGKFLADVGIGFKQWHIGYESKVSWIIEQDHFKVVSQTGGTKLFDSLFSQWTVKKSENQ